MAPTVGCELWRDVGGVGSRRQAASRPVADTFGGPAMRLPGLSVEGSSGVRGAAATSVRGPGRLGERRLSW
ncbi:hypothetical protein NDU88_000962 [Pleurodeles waltl]|uniref:Uncharacterized protein n=1 Tax=Pleurodeles waltl TaxID=8319 RepID=A0AAV7KNC2_PLEWA|nr:hypothetical protein NDU88_000962 [Pleurodeles waltl]